MGNYVSNYIGQDHESIPDPDDEGVRDIVSHWYVLAGSLLVVAVYIGIGTFSYALMEDWSIGESFYFSAVTLTTIGYGNLSPTTTLSRVFTMIYILIGLSMIGIALGIIGSYLLQRQNNLLERAVKVAEDYSTKKIEDEDDENQTLLEKMVSINWYNTWWFRTIISFGIIFVVSIINMVCFYFMGVDPDHNENGFFIAFYFSLVSSTTVGYGDFYPEHKASSVPFILVSTSIVAAALGNIADIIMNYQQEKMANKILNKGLTHKSITFMDADDDGQVDPKEFLEYMLVHMGKVDQATIQHINNQFNKLDADNSGYLDYDDLDSLVDQM
eukprot:TRINITY_DN1065_c0_g1_i1.p1 TRINITY_DN1065_c0_g1~~TRINITY_DN1065_c0_g1_i1.p1  ORF type:complete len:328 (-),score=93.10 TRINITY_DN1065_c0_g1_i1:191-1174(-)